MYTEQLISRPNCQLTESHIANQYYVISKEKLLLRVRNCKYKACSTLTRNTQYIEDNGLPIENHEIIIKKEQQLSESRNKADEGTLFINKNNSGDDEEKIGKNFGKNNSFR